MSCLITGSINGKNCGYTVAGARRLVLANWFRAVLLTGAAPEGGEVPVANQIGYRSDTSGEITAIVLPPDQELYEMPVAELSVNYLDALLIGANNAKYRQHTVNAVLNADPLDMLANIDPLALGKFVAFVTRKDDTVKVLGRNNGLQAPVNGADDGSGTAEADSAGFILILQGTSKEAAPIVLDESIIDALVAAPVVVVP